MIIQTIRCVSIVARYISDCVACLMSAVKIYKYNVNRMNDCLVNKK